MTEKGTAKSIEPFWFSGSLLEPACSGDILIMFTRDNIANQSMNNYHNPDLSNTCLKILSDRKKQNSKRHSRSDNYKMGLVIEGGGMRGVITGAMTAALEQLHFQNSFDAVYGSSAGAIAAVFFVAEQASLGASVYFNYINNSKFISMKRLVSKTRSAMDIDYLVKDVFRNKVVLNYKKILNSDLPFHIVLTDATSFEKTVLSEYSSQECIENSLIATASNPVVSNGPVKVGGSNYWDGSLSESIPIKTAIDDGCTHIVILRSLPFNQLPMKWNALHKTVASLKNSSNGAYLNGLKDQLGKDIDSYKSELKLIKNNEKKIAEFHSTSDSIVDMLEINHGVLLLAAKNGYQAIINRLCGFGDRQSVPEVGIAITHY